MSSLSHHCISIFQSSRNFLSPFLNFFSISPFYFLFGAVHILRQPEEGAGIRQMLTIADEGGGATFRKNIVISTAGLRIGVVRDFRPSYHPTNHPFIAFEHSSLKGIQASLWH